MRNAELPELCIRRTISADSECLFRAWTEPDQLRHWWHLGQKGWSFQSATVDLCVGGRFRLGMTGPDGKSHVALGEYREVRHASRLVFTWRWENPRNDGEQTLVTVDFNRVGTNSTQIVLTHTLIADEKTRQGHERGWAELMSVLEQYATGAGL